MVEAAEAVRNLPGIIVQAAGRQPLAVMIPQGADLSWKRVMTSSFGSRYDKVVGNIAVEELARETYIKTIDQGFAPLVVELDRAITAAHPDLEAAVRYRMLMYAVRGDFRHWICAIGATNNRICLRFLYGSSLGAAPGTLRAGSTTMGTIDLTAVQDVDARLIGDLVDRAIVRVGEVKAGEASPLSAKIVR